MWQFGGYPHKQKSAWKQTPNPSLPIPVNTVLIPTTSLSLLFPSPPHPQFHINEYGQKTQYINEYNMRHQQKIGIGPSRIQDYYVYSPLQTEKRRRQQFISLSSRQHKPKMADFTFYHRITIVLPSKKI